MEIRTLTLKVAWSYIITSSAKGKPTQLKQLYLILGIVVLNNANKVTNLEAQLIHILLGVAIGGLHPVQNSRRQVSSIGICLEK